MTSKDVFPNFLHAASAMMVGTIVYDYYEMYTLYILSQLYRSLNFFTFYLHGHFPEK